MPLRNACFISYRHGQYELMQQFTTDFYAALRSELEPMLGSSAVYLDQDRLAGGQLYTEALAVNLYESATMVMVYTPTYFSPEHTYCAREYKAMEALEKQRLSRMGVAADKSHGLIIPIILRGGTYIPEEIRKYRQCYDFESFQLGGRRLSRHPRFAPAMREIASYICGRYYELRSLPEDFFADADQFGLPDENDIKPFLDINAGFKMPFPRGEHWCTPQPLWARS